MKVAIDLTSFNREFRGGKEQVICNLIAGFVRQTPQMKLVLFCYEDYREKAVTMAKDAEIITFKRWKLKKFIQDMYIRTFVIKHYLKGVQVIFFPIYYSGFYKFSIPSVILPHDIQFKSQSNSFNIITRLKDSILYFCDFTLRDYIVAISDFDYKEMIKFYPSYESKIKKIYNPIMVDNTKNKSKRNHLLSVNIGFTHKNIRTLIKAYSLIAEKIDLPLILVGQLYDDIKVNELIKSYKLEKKIKYMGYVDDLQLKQLFIDAYAYITTSAYEGFGMTVIEAMLYNVPVISSKQDALVEVTFNKAIYYEPYNDEKVLSEKIISLIDNYPKADYLDELKNMATKEYSYKKISMEYFKFFSNIINQVCYVDPMSYHNLALYDNNLLSHMKEMNIIYIGNQNYNLTEDYNIYRLYDYSKYNFFFLKQLVI